jgi:phosphoglycerate dehydrogenase-like enzyme
VHLPVTPQTRGLLDDAALRTLRPDAILVSVGRGEVVDEGALAAAPNVIFTPHVRRSVPR